MVQTEYDKCDGAQDIFDMNITRDDNLESTLKSVKVLRRVIKQMISILMTIPVMIQKLTS